MIKEGFNSGFIQRNSHSISVWVATIHSGELRPSIEAPFQQHFRFHFLLQIQEKSKAILNISLMLSIPVSSDFH